MGIVGWGSSSSSQRSGKYGVSLGLATLRVKETRLDTRIYPRMLGGDANFRVALFFFSACHLMRLDSQSDSSVPNSFVSFGICEVNFAQNCISGRKAGNGHGIWLHFFFVLLGCCKGFCMVRWVGGAIGEGSS